MIHSTKNLGTFLLQPKVYVPIIGGATLSALMTLGLRNDDPTLSVVEPEIPRLEEKNS